MEDKIVCIYHNDNDGITAAGIVNLEFSNVKFIPMDYGWDFDMNEIKDKTCIVVDFSFPNMQKIKDTCKTLIWIDHHKTAMENNPEIWNDKDVLGIRNLTKAGCELTWEYLIPSDNKMPNVVKWVGDYDTWTFKYDETKAFGASFGVEIKAPNAVDLKQLLTGVSAQVIEDDLIEKGEILLKAQIDRVKESFKQGRKIKFHSLNGFICNSNVDDSNLGNYICKQGYDVGIVWSVDKDLIRVSLRSIGETDVSIIAKKHGGGGHKNAAGFELHLNDINLLL